MATVAAFQASFSPSNAMRPSPAQLPNETILANAARDLRVSYSDAQATTLYEGVRTLLLHFLHETAWRFVEQIEAASRVAAETCNATREDDRTQSRLALRILLTFRPDAVVEQLPGRHHYGLALYLLSETDDGKQFIRQHLPVSLEDIELVRDERQRAILEPDGDRGMLVTLEELLRSKLTRPDRLDLRLNGPVLLGGEQPLRLNTQRATLMQMLLTRESLTHEQIRVTTGYSSPPKQVARLTTALKQSGIELRFSPNSNQRVQFIGAVRCEPTEK